MSKLENQSIITSVEVEKKPSLLRRAKKAAGVLAVGAVAAATGHALVAQGEGVPCDPNMDVCVPGVTVPEDQDPVPGNPQPGETIPVDSIFDDKGPEESTTTSTTIPESTTTSTTIPESTTTSTTIPESTTTSTTIPESTTTSTTTIVSTPPTMPPITVTVPSIPGETN